jgi:aminoglycoside phosphotransferase (APT) family kinase protein
MATDAIERRRRVLAAAGLPPALAMARVPSYANEVWVGDEVVVRINHHALVGGAPARLLREAAIAARLPREARYPELLDIGRNSEMSWIVSRRAPGVVLGRAWGAMRPAERERAIGELGEVLSAVHATPAVELTSELDIELDPPHTLPLPAILALIDDLLADGGDPALYRDIAALVRERWTAFDDSGIALVHGDPHLENVLWDGTRISALLDLEWSRCSWIECDLEILLAIADHPALFSSADYAQTIDAADYAAVPGWLRSAQPAWFAHPRLLDRLEVLHVSRTLSFLGLDPRSEVRLAHLRAVLSGTSYLRRQLGG